MKEWQTRSKWNGLKQAQDNLTVIVATQDRPGRMLVDHQEWLEQHTQDIARHREFVQEHAAMIQEIDRKLDRLTELIIKGHSGNGGGNGS